VDRRVRSFSAFKQFDVIFRPGALEKAPHRFVAALKGPRAAAARAELQNAVVEALPNVTLFDALDEINEIRHRIAEASRLVTILGAFVSACGILILAGSITVTTFQRTYEAAILKTVGARRGVLVKIAMIEYGVLGFLAGLIGSTAAIALTWVMTTYIRVDYTWQFRPAINIVAVVLTVLLVTTVGVLASWDVLVKKPLGVLREQ
jgi:putative ABC transport system permease protein